MDQAHLRGYTVFEQLRREDVPLRLSVQLGDGMAAVLWERGAGISSRFTTRYADPTHHTFSLYLEGGDGIRRSLGQAVRPSEGAGSLCLMPSDVTSTWEISGPVRLFHLYVPRAAVDRVVAEALGCDPALVSLRDATYFRDPYMESVIRNSMLPLDWSAPADRLALSHASQMLIAYAASRYTDRDPRALVARGGLAPAARRRVLDYIEANLDRPLVLGDLAGVAGLSAYHFARMFKRAVGESPHGFVLRRRVERARRMIAAGSPLADVALACGFSGQSHFTARFRAVTGLTPGRFQRSLG